MATRTRRRLYGRNYYSRRGTTSTSARRAVGNYRAAQQQKDITSVNLNIVTKADASVMNKEINNEVKPVGVFALNIWDLLRRSEFYQSYANMYDQVKIDKIRLKLTPVNWTFNTQNTNAFKAITVVTAWDRTGLSDEQYEIQATAIDPDYGLFGLQGNTDGLYIKMNNEIGTYSSAQTRNLNPGSSLSIIRNLYPSNIQEKAFYVNTADLKEWYTNYDKLNCRYYGIEVPGWVAGNPQSIQDSAADKNIFIGALKQSPSVSANPCFIGEDAAIAFKPTFLLGLLTNAPPADYEANVVLDGPVTFNIEADVGVTFRGLRKARIVE